MVEIYRALRSFLLADATIAAAVGTRIYPIILPQNVTYPAVTIFMVHGMRANVLRGPASLALPKYQIDCWTRQTSGLGAYIAAHELGSAVRARIEAYSGTMSDPATSPDSLYRVGVVFDVERERFEGDINGGYFVHSADYVVSHGVHTVPA